MLHSYTRTGKYNNARNFENQDAVFAAENEEYVFIALADGVSECICGGTGAQIACRAAADIMLNETDRMLGFSKEKTAYLLLEHVLYTIECAQAECELCEYASTLMCALIEKKTGDALLFNLGDGSAFRICSGDMSAALLPNTINGVPVQTTAGNAYMAAEVKRLRLKPGEMIVLFSDGMTAAFEENRVFGQYLRKGDMENADAELEATQSNDDMSYIMCMFR